MTLKSARFSPQPLYSGCQPSTFENALPICPKVPEQDVPMAVLGPDTCWLSSWRGVSADCWPSAWIWEGFAQLEVGFGAIHTGSWFSPTTTPG